MKSMNIYCAVISYLLIRVAYGGNIKTDKVLSLSPNVSAGTSSEVTERVLSRRKRYLTFPEGSSVQLIYCLTIPVLATELSYAYGYTVSMAYQLPQDTRFFLKEHKSPEAMHRRDRRDLYPKIETFLESRGLDGRQCVLRALCEAGQRSSNKGEFMEEILHTIFTLPQVEDADEEEAVHYDEAHRSYLNCPMLYPDCPTSILHLVMSRPISK